MINCIVCLRECGEEFFRCTRASHHCQKVNQPDPAWCPKCFPDTICGRGADQWHGPGCRSRCSNLMGKVYAPEPTAKPTVRSVSIMQELLTERARYLDFQAKGCTIKSDDSFTKGELARQAASYAMWASNHDYLFATISNDSNEAGGSANCGYVNASSVLWPFRSKNGGPTVTENGRTLTDREALVRAGALIIGEIERIDRRDKAKP